MRSATSRAWIAALAFGVLFLAPVGHATASVLKGPKDANAAHAALAPYAAVVPKRQPTQINRFVIRTDVSASAQLKAAGIEAGRSIDYGSFLWLEVSGAELARLKAAGVRVEIQDEARELQVTAHRFDPLAEGEPDVAMKSAESDGRGFRLVQFEGPTKPQWLESMRSAGLAPLQYYPHNAYLVWSNGQATEALASLDFVRWHGAFHPSYKINGDLQGRSGRVGNVTVVFYNDGDIEGTLATLESLGGTVIGHHPSQPDRTFFDAVVELDASAFDAVAALETVLWLGYSHPEPMLEDEMSGQIIAGNHPGGVPVLGYAAHLATLGYTGAGVRWAVIDTGVDYDHPDLGTNIVAGYSFPGACNPAGQPGSDCSGGGHGTHVAGIIGGTAAAGFTDANGFLYGLGVAPGYGIVAMNSLSASAWPPTGGWQEHSKQAVLMQSVGTNNSWHTGEGTAHGYQASERTHDFMVHDGNFDTPAVIEPIIWVFSAGNSGPGANTLTAPKEAKNAIVVASSRNYRVGSIDTLSSFSSRGPAMDGRIVPTISAPGEQIASSRNDLGGSCSTAIAGTNNLYAFCSGTSMAAPQVSGALALATEWWRDFNEGANPTPAMAKALLVNSAVDMGAADRPNANEGWGRINITEMLAPSLNTEYFDSEHLFTSTGESFTTVVAPADPSQPVKITLAWTDAPGAVGANPALVNNLDLVVADGATEYFGNVFSAGWSATGGVRDTRNNLENVFIQSPSGDAITITVDATNIAGNGAFADPGATDQRFALVCSNCVREPDYTLNLSPNSLLICAPDSAQSTVSIGQLMGYDDPVSLSVAGAPLGVTALLDEDEVTPPDATVLTVSADAQASWGNSVLTLTADSTSGSKQRDLALALYTATPTAPSLQLPIQNANYQSLTPSFQWSAIDQTQTYLLEVATDSGFNNLVLQQAVSGNSFQMTSPLQVATNYWWRVRAENVCGSSPQSGVFRFQTAPEAGECLPGDEVIVHFEDNMEGGTAGWTSSGTGNTWAQSTALPRSPVTSWLGAGSSSISDQRLQSPAIALPADAASPVLVFHHVPNLENNGATGCFDGGILEASTNGGAAWTQVPASQMLAEPYTGVLSSAYSNPLAGAQAWCSAATTTYRRTVVDASPWAGETVSLRFRIGTDTSVSRPGWHIDDVELRSCSTRHVTSATISVDADPARLGEPVEVSVTVSSAGPATDGGVEITASSGESCEVDAPTEVVGSTAIYRCELSFDSYGPRNLSAEVESTPTHAGSSADPMSLSVMRIASLSVTADDGRSEIGNGEEASYLIEVRNAGPDAAVDVPLQVTVSPQLDGAQWTCTASGGASCPADSGQGGISTSLELPAGGGLDYVLTGEVAAAQATYVELDAVIAPSSLAPAFVHDPDTGDNAAQDVNLVRDIFSDQFEEE